jgi:hypothetical protein
MLVCKYSNFLGICLSNADSFLLSSGFISNVAFAYRSLFKMHLNSFLAVFLALGTDFFSSDM